MSAPRVLIAGLGNIFLGDDGFGPAVIEKLRPLPARPGVRVVDFGVRARELVFALEECEVAILIDATMRGEPPGTLYVLAPDQRAEENTLWDGHSLTVDQVLRLLPAQAQPQVIRIVGCEPQTLEPDAPDMGLSAVVSAAVDAAVPLVERLLAELLTKLPSEHGAAAHA